jgi:hypothetical protein
MIYVLTLHFTRLLENVKTLTNQTELHLYNLVISNVAYCIHILVLHSAFDVQLPALKVHVMFQKISKYIAYFA